MPVWAIYGYADTFAPARPDCRSFVGERADPRAGVAAGCVRGHPGFGLARGRFALFMCPQEWPGLLLGQQ